MLAITVMEQWTIKLLYYIIDNAKEIFSVVTMCRVPKC
jgi:hypothetical protein